METLPIAVPFKGDPFAARPAGLVGELTDYFEASAPYPLRPIALVGALALMAGVTGKAYNVSNTGLNLYFICLAPSGYGKEAIASGINRLDSMVGMVFPEFGHFIGPSDLLYKKDRIENTLSGQSSFVSVLGEASSHFRTMRVAAAMSTARRLIMDLYGKSGKSEVFRECVPAVKSPAISLVAESTPELFWPQLSGATISDGFFARFVFMEYKGDRPLKNPNQQLTPPDSLVGGLAGLARTAAALISNNRHGVDVGLSPEAQRLFDRFNAAIEEETNGNTTISHHCWSRAHLKALRLAAVVAVGIDNANPVIDEDTAAWAIAYVQKDVATVFSNSPQSIAGKADLRRRQLTHARSATWHYSKSDYEDIKVYLQSPKQKLLWEAGIVTDRYYVKKLGPLHAFKTDPEKFSKAISRTLSRMVEAGELSRVAQSEVYAMIGAKPTSYRINFDVLVHEGNWPKSGRPRKTD